MGVLLFLVEGVTDQTTLESPLINLFLTLGEERPLFFHPANGDLTAKGGKKGTSTRDGIKKEIETFCQEKKLTIKDIDVIVQLTDLDASFAPKSTYIESKSISRQTYVPEECLVYVEEKESLYFSRKRKADNLLFLVEGRTLWIKRRKIPHLLCYFSINLEHALYGEANCRTHEKKEFAFRFEEEFAEDASAFKKLLEELGKGREDYLASWQESYLLDHAYERGSNLYAGLECILGVQKMPLL